MYVGNVNLTKEVENCFDYKALLDKLIFESYSNQYVNAHSNNLYDGVRNPEATDFRQYFEK